MIDKAMAYSVLVTWLDCQDNPEREKWCYQKMLSLLLPNERDTISFMKAQRDHAYLDLLAELLPELAYQFNSWLFLRQMKEISEYHSSEKWNHYMEIAKTKIKAPHKGQMDF